jgi:hypothetical protein
MANKVRIKVDGYIKVVGENDEGYDEYAVVDDKGQEISITRLNGILAANNECLAKLTLTILDQHR